MTVSEAIKKLNEIKNVVGDVDMLVQNEDGIFNNNVRINGAKVFLTASNTAISTFPYAYDKQRPVCLIRYGS